MNKKKKEVESVPHFVGVQGPFYDFLITDPMGSYTGVPIRKEDLPVQDADDL